MLVAAGAKVCHWSSVTFRLTVLLSVSVFIVGHFSNTLIQEAIKQYLCYVAFIDLRFTITVA